MININMLSLLPRSKENDRTCVDFRCGSGDPQRITSTDQYVWRVGSLGAFRYLSRLKWCRMTPRV